MGPASEVFVFGGLYDVQVRIVGPASEVFVFGGMYDTSFYCFSLSGKTGCAFDCNTYLCSTILCRYVDRYVVCVLMYTMYE